MKNVIRAVVTPLLMLSVVFGSVPAYADDATTSGTVTFVDDGGFSISLCGASDFGSVPVTSSTGGTATVTVTICYIDDQLQRDEFVVTLAASDFTIGEQDPSALIPAGNLRVAKTWSPMRITSEGCELTPPGEDVGLIYASAGEGDPLWPVVPGEPVNSVVWGENSFASPVIVGGGLEGGGTASCDGAPVDITADVELELTVPPAQKPGDYSTTLVVNIPVNEAP